MAGSWQSSDFHDPANPGCSIGGSGSIANGRLIMGASFKHPIPMVLIVRKTTWSMPLATQLRVTAGFSDGASISINGLGQGQTVEFDLSEPQLRDWVHELTSATQMRLAFGGSEPAWSFDLTGTTTVINAMGDCLREHNVAGLSPPFGPMGEAPVGTATQPFDPTDDHGAVALSPEALIPDAGAQGVVLPRSPGALVAPVATPSPPYHDPVGSTGSSIPIAQQPHTGAADRTLWSWHGSSNMQTRPFHVDGPWELQWRNARGLFIVTLHRLLSSTPQDVSIASGVEASASSAYQPTGGDFYLEIQADEPWSLRAVLVPFQPGVGTAADQSVPLEAPLLNVEGDQSALPACDGPDGDETVTHLVEQSPMGQTLHVKVLHVGAPMSRIVRGGMSVCTVTLTTNGGESHFSYQFYRKDGEVYVFGKIADQ